ncbi:rhodanese-like domain-containing protein [Peribacillus saganii]|uniref:Rhodanese-like domain-containing protein n=1 Tax=Peribacillus saganii TaxID=2303992 RepID=A0A372LNN3_9BACI|nr:rhodanese-like domain-containing protein [Peribacillus saganii]RFU69258.1 rhodanese-like domain-containing protein [Peribacillus saganii]
MEYLNYLLIGLIVYFLLQRLLPAKGVNQITTSELRSELKNKTKQFIDVRTAAEFRANHINGFRNIPLHELNRKANEIPKDKEVILICQSGMRSNKASEVLRKLGYHNVTNVKGGMSAWS